MGEFKPDMSPIEEEIQETRWPEIVGRAIIDLQEKEELMMTYLQKVLVEEMGMESPSIMIKKIISLYIQENNLAGTKEEAESVENFLEKNKKEIRKVLLTKYLEACQKREKDKSVKKPDKTVENIQESKPSIEAPINRPADQEIAKKDKKSQAGGELPWHEEINDEREK